MEILLFKAEEKEQEKIALMVDRIMTKNAEFHRTSQNMDKWHSLKTEIEKLDREIDEAIYKLYGLTAQEIRTIEK